MKNNSNNIPETVFEDYLCERNDVLDNAAHELLCMIANPAYNPEFSGPDDPNSLEWDMALIGELLDCAESILADHDIHSCHPFYEGDETPCCNGEDCNNPNCPLKK